MARNMQVLLASRPTGWVEESNFRIVETDVPKPGPGEVLVKNLWLSLDPYMRGRMNAVKSYSKYVEIGEVMVGGTVGQVVESLMLNGRSVLNCQFPRCLLRATRDTQPDNDVAAGSTSTCPASGRWK